MLDVGIEQTGSKRQDIYPFLNDHVAIFGKITAKELSPFWVKESVIADVRRKCAEKPQSSAFLFSSHSHVWPPGLEASLVGAQQSPPLARLRAFKSSQSRWNTDCNGKKKVFGGSGLSPQPLRSDFLVFAPNMRSRGLVEKCGDTTCQVRVRELG